MSSRVAASLCLLLSASACQQTQGSYEAGVGGDRTGCGAPGSHSVELADHSCVCEDGYEWCSDALDDFTCCPSDETDGDTGETLELPDLPCGFEQAEQLYCEDGEELAQSRLWVCNGETWLAPKGLMDWHCIDLGFDFAFGCEGASVVEFACGRGPGNPCDPELPGICTTEDVIDVCLWGRRTIDYCERLCVELEISGGPAQSGTCVGFDSETGACECS